MGHMPDLNIPLENEINFNYDDNQCSSQCFFEGKILKQLSKFTVCKHKVPCLFHEPYVLRGYRLIDRPWLYYIFSIFKLHNESVNIWSHILASLLVFKKFRHFSRQMDFINDSSTWPLLAGILSSITMFALSFSAHCLQSKSCVVHYIAFMLDYAGIGMYILGSTIMFLEYSSADQFFSLTKEVFVYCGIFMSCAAFVGCCMSKIIYERPYPFARKLWQIIPVGGGYLLLISPIFHRLYECIGNDICAPTFNLHVSHIIWFLISTLFFSCQLPQSRAHAGSCDHFFHSHQLFHFSIMISILIQLDSVHQDFTIFGSAIRLRSKPTFVSAFVPVIFVFCFEILSLCLFYVLVDRKLKSKAM